VALIISPKELDQQMVKSASGMEIVTLPAVGFSRGRVIAFFRGFHQSYRNARDLFAAKPPQAVLAMGGFTSVPPVLAGRRVSAATFLHESNSIPGRANRFLARWVDQAFVGFPVAVKRLPTRIVSVTGTPVREQFRLADPPACRTTLGLDAQKPVLLVMGGSQGASGINQLLVRSLPLFAEQFPEMQFVHLTGVNDCEKIRAAYAAHGRAAVVRPFLTEMELALSAATAAISRAGASSLAEFAAMRLPAVLIPYPEATDNHQFFNARAFVESGAARMLVQGDASPELLLEMIRDMIENPNRRQAMITALERWHHPDAAEKIAGHLVAAMVKNGVPMPVRPNAEAEAESPAPKAGVNVVEKLQVA
jgi:UDP-N-acetylglucosamine--N-acetylmuramyl-(pentapeptide) pyrophosphoryl-undecaprenol N-acetylglucosamine transferase